MQPKFHFQISGFCPCCSQDVVFEANNIWLRDSLLCSNCGSIPRERALMVIIQKYYPNWKELSIHESSPEMRGTSKKLMAECKDYIGSQFFPNSNFGEIINGYRNEDLEKQTFEDEIFDIVVTQDVMEHIYSPEKAFSEIARTLKRGGAYIFTVPIINHFNKTEIWAKKAEDGSPIFLRNPEYHSNPVDSKGSPVTMHWGYDIVDYIHKYSNLDSKIEYIYDLSKGIWAEYIDVIVSQKY